MSHISIAERFWNLIGRFDPFAKPVNCLTLRDLRRYPIWEFATDTEGLPCRDETWVRALRRFAVPWDAYSLTVAATMTIRSGQDFEGTAYVSTPHGTVDVQMGMIVVGREWYDIPNPGQWREAEKRAELVAALGGSLEMVFPIRWTLNVPLEGESNPGSGFLSGS